MKEKKIKLLTEIIAIVVICLISFVGVFKINKNQVENSVKDYLFAKEFAGYREFVFELENSEDENANEENYNKSKKIIEERLKKLGVEDFNVSQNTENGSIYVQIPENSETDHIAGNILQVADFKVTDSDDEEKVLLTNNDLQKVSAIYNTTSSGTTVYLQIKFNKNGKNILKEISTGEYATKSQEESKEGTEESNDENDVTANATVKNNETENSSDSTENTTNNTENDQESSEQEANSEETGDKAKDAQKKIKLSIDGNAMITTSFDDPIEDGTLYLSMGQATTDRTKISDSLKSTSTIGVVLNSGKMPLSYKIAEDRFINETNKETLKNVMLAITIVAIVSLLFLCVKYKFRGIIASIAFIGFVACYLLVVRYFNVVVSYESIVAFAIALAINFVIIKNLLNVQEKDKELKKLAYKNSLKATITSLLPLFIISVIFVFIKVTYLSTFGMSMFWGITLGIIYNYNITRDMLN